MYGEVMQILSTVINIFVRSCILGLVLMYGWNFGVVKFFPHAPYVELLESIIVLILAQTMSMFCLYPIKTEVLPIFIPMDKAHSKEDSDN